VFTALRFPEKNLALHLLYCVRNAVTLEDNAIKKLSTIAGVYLAKMAELLFQVLSTLFFDKTRNVV